MNVLCNADWRNLQVSSVPFMCCEQGFTIVRRFGGRKNLQYSGRLIFPESLIGGTWLYTLGQKYTYVSDHSI